MEFSPDVDTDDANPTLWLYLGALAARHRSLTGYPLHVTSMRRPGDHAVSGHNPPAGVQVYSADVRRWTLDAQQKTAMFVSEARALYGDELLVLMEPEDVSQEEYARLGLPWPPSPHLHVQLRVRTWPILL